MSGDQKCPTCGNVEKVSYMARYVAREEVMRQTPREVWDGYLENGYTLIQAVSEELSNA